MSGRVTPAGGGREQTVSTMRQRNPLMWWVAVIVAVGLILSTVGGGIAIFLFG